MKATALVCDENQEFTLEPVVLGGPAPHQVAIRTHYTGVSIGTELGYVSAKTPVPYPLSTGYQGTGVIEAVGADVSGFDVGDQVYFRRNDSMELEDGTRVTCTSGAHCSHVVTDPHTTHGVAKLPPGARMDVACMYVMPAVGLYGVDMANPRMGEVVVVYGAGLIGLGVVAACAHRGCEVVAVDLDETRLAVARKMGADHVIDGSSQDVEAEVRRIAPDGADVVFEATGIPQNVDPAISLCRRHGSFVWQGNYGNAPLSMHFLPPHHRRLRMFFPCDDGWQPCRRAVIKNMAMGALPWEHCITHRIDHTEAPEMFSRLNRGDREGIVGVVIDWTGAPLP